MVKNLLSLNLIRKKKKTIYTLAMRRRGESYEN